MKRPKRALAALMALGILVAAPACSDDDGDGNPEVQIPDDVDVDVDQGKDTKGD